MTGTTKTRTKRRINIWLDYELIAQAEAIAAARDVPVAQVLREQLRAGAARRRA